MSWLGVIHYLSLETFGATLRALSPCWLAGTGLPALSIGNERSPLATKAT